MDTTADVYFAHIPDDRRDWLRERTLGELLSLMEAVRLEKMHVRGPVVAELASRVL